MTETIAEKPIYKRLLACFCSLCLCSLFVLFGFSVPRVHADDASLYQQYLDSLPGKIIDGPMSPADGVALGLQLGLQQAYETRITAGSSFSADSIVTLTGKYAHNNELHLCWTGVDSSIPYEVASGGVTLAQSDEFLVRAIVTSNPSATRYSYSVNSYVNSSFAPTLYMFCPSYSTVSLTVTDSLGSSIFADNINSSFVTSNAYYYINCLYSGQSIPSLPDNSNLSVYFGQRSNISTFSPIAGWLNYSPKFAVSDIPGASEFTFTSDNFIDFITTIYNPWIEENYPDLVLFLFYPSEDNTEDTTGEWCDTCHCYHEIHVHVNVEPTINVYINPWELPEGETGYTMPSTPAHETIPFPTQDSSNTEPVTMPTMDLEEFQQTYKSAFDFWFYCAEQLITRMHLELLLAFVFVITVVGFILWRLGG